jgi:hypothetical protein
MSIEFVSLNSIVNDLLNIVRGSKLNSSEPISKRQIEAWIHQYRAFLLKRDLDKNKFVDTDYIQNIPFKLVKEDLAGSDTTISTGKYIYRTSLNVPNTIDLNFKSGITHVGDLSGNEIQLSNGVSRTNHQKYKKYTSNDVIAYLKDRYIYLYNNNKGLQYILVRGIFENPVEVYELTNPLTNQRVASYDDKYPIPMDKIPVLKELILTKELGIEAVSPSDNKGDSNSKFEPNISK